jgi:hypothetical protein
MADQRAERLANNEGIFRIANERKAGWEERQSSDQPELYLCECADPGCRLKVALTLPEYEGVRRSSRHFFVTSGHEIPEVETVIEDHENWLVIEKDPEVTDVVQRSDPRQP